MRRHPRAHIGAGAVHKVEHARRHARIMANLREKHPRHRRDFRRLQHHGATRNQGRGHFAGDLVHRPVPRRDQRTNPDPLADDPSGAAHLFPMEGFRRLQRGLDMHLPRPHLSAPRPFNRRAHLSRHHLRKLFRARVVDLQHPTQDGNALSHRAHGPAVKGRPRRRDGRIDIRLIAQGDLGHDLFGCGVFHPHPRRRMRRDPLAVDIELIHIFRDHNNLT